MDNRKCCSFYYCYYSILEPVPYQSTIEERCSSFLVVGSFTDKTNSEFAERLERKPLNRLSRSFLWDLPHCRRGQLFKHLVGDLAGEFSKARDVSLGYTNRSTMNQKMGDPAKLFVWQKPILLRCPAFERRKNFLSGCKYTLNCTFATDAQLGTWTKLDLAESSSYSVNSLASQQIVDASVSLLD